MEQLEEGECYAGSYFLLADWVQTSTEKLQISGNFAVTSAVAERDFMHAGGMDDPKSFVTWSRSWAFHTGVIQVNYKTHCFESCPFEKGTIPFLGKE